MYLSKKTKKAICLLLGFVFLAIFGIFAGINGNIDIGSAQTAFVEVPEINSQYSIGDTFVLPKGVKLTDGQAEYDAVVTVRDSAQNGYASDFTMITPGKYVVEYKALANGRFLQKKQSFICLDNSYSVSSQRSSAVYGVNDMYPGTAPGIKVSIAPGDEFTFNGAIDFNNREKTENIVSLYVTPLSLYTSDALQLTVTFTDIKDPGNFVEIAIKQILAANPEEEWANKNSYATARAANQPAVGLHTTGSSQVGDIVWEGVKYIIYKNSNAGTNFVFSMPGGYSPTEENLVAHQSIDLSFDYELKRPYVNNKVIVDLDDIAFFDDLWDGFTTGYAKMSIKAEKYNASSANFVITDIYGYDNLEVNTIADTVAPHIEIDYSGYSSQQLPKAILNQPYPIYTAKAFDLNDGDIAVNSVVFYNYGKYNSVNIPVVNGKFIPTMEGVYTIEYSAYDYAGNESKEYVNIESTASLTALSITTSGEVTVGKTGISINVATPSLLGGTGKQYFSIEAVHSSSGHRISLSLDNLSFVPFYSGTYNIVYSYGDYITQKKYSYDINITAENNPYIVDMPTLPKYFIKGAKYELPDATGYLFPNGNAQSAKASLSVSQDGGAFTPVNGVFTVTASSNVEIEYSITLGSKKSSIRQVVDVIDTRPNGKLDISKYFVGDFNAEPSSSDITFKPNVQTDGKASLLFANKVLAAEEVSSQFNITNGINNYDKVNVYLRDYADSAIALKLSYIKKGNKAVFELNDNGIYYDIDADFGLGTAKFIANYTKKSNSVVLSGTRSVRADFDILGNQFNGFPSNFVSIEFELEGIKDINSVGIIISRINNQIISNITADITSPQITMNVDNESYTTDDIVVIKPTFAADVLSPYIQFTVEVRDPDGNIVTAQDGTVLDATADPSKAYEIKLSQLGTYLVSYAADDGNETAYYSYIFRAVDLDPPIITLTDIKTNAKLGSQVSFAKYSVTDNVDSPEDLKVYIYLYVPGGKIISATGSQSFMAEIEGVYRVTYYTIDAEGNATHESYTVTVS